MDLTQAGKSKGRAGWRARARSKKINRTSTLAKDEGVNVVINVSSRKGEAGGARASRIRNGGCLS